MNLPFINYQTHHGGCENSPYTRISNSAWAITDGQTLFEKCRMVPDRIPAAKVHIARKPISMPVETTGAKNKQHLYPVCEKAPKNMENKPLTSLTCSWIKPLKTSSSILPISAATKAKGKSGPGNKEASRCQRYMTAIPMPMPIPVEINNRDLGEKLNSPVIFFRSAIDFRWLAITKATTTSAPYETRITGNLEWMNQEKIINPRLQKIAGNKWLSLFKGDIRDI